MLPSRCNFPAIAIDVSDRASPERKLHADVGTDHADPQAMLKTLVGYLCNASQVYANDGVYAATFG